MEEGDYATTYRLEADNWWFVGMRRTSLALVAGIGRGQPDPPPGPVLDVGCGTGILLEELGDEAVGLDRSAVALAFCRERRLDGLVQGSGDRLPFADRTFGVVTAIGVVEHIDDDAGSVAEWARVLVPGGRLVLLSSAHPWMWSGHDLSNHHVRRYRLREVRALLEDAGLEVERLSLVNATLFAPIAAVRLVERVLARRRGFAARKDTGTVPAPVNRALTALLAAEARVLAHRPLPLGVSLVASARRPMASQAHR